MFAAFAPDPSMVLYGRGIRRRLAPMLGGDRRRIEMAYALQFTLPGVPVIRYGEEIGMGDDLSLPDRDAIRTPMQWSDAANGGFSTGPEEGPPATRSITGGDYGFETVNVAAQLQDPESLLGWFQRALHSLRDCPEFGVGETQYVDTGERSVLALRRDAPGGTMLALTNLADKAVTVDLGPQPGQEGPIREVFADGSYDPPGDELTGLRIGPYGYRWIRIRETLGR